MNGRHKYGQGDTEQKIGQKKVSKRSNSTSVALRAMALNQNSMAQNQIFEGFFTEVSTAITGLHFRSSREKTIEKQYELVGKAAFKMRHDLDEHSSLLPLSKKMAFGFISSLFYGCYFAYLQYETTGISPAHPQISLLDHLQSLSRASVEYSTFLKNALSELPLHIQISALFQFGEARVNSHENTFTPENYNPKLHYEHFVNWEAERSFLASLSYAVQSILNPSMMQQYYTSLSQYYPLPDEKPQDTNDSLAGIDILLHADALLHAGTPSETLNDPRRASNICFQKK